MAHSSWPLAAGRPAIQVVLSFVEGQQSVTRVLLADTGAGSVRSGFELILDEDDCLQCGGFTGDSVNLSGAYRGSFPVYLLRIQIPALGFDQDIRAVGVSDPPAGLDGIACFRFLNRFAYGNSGDPAQFGLEL